MYDVALSVLACLRAGTAVHVAWLPTDVPSDGSQAVALTPGGGHIGSMLGGALDDTVRATIERLGKPGGTFDVSLGPVEALITGLPEGLELTIAVVEGSVVPEDVWEALARRDPVSFAFDLDGRRITGIEVLAPSDEPAHEDRLICRFSPVPRMVIVGGGPIADALVKACEVIGWSPIVSPVLGEAGGVTASLSPIDGVVVMGHDVEASAGALRSAIESNAGYIGSIGSPAMQQLREEWLAYRGVPWSDRIHGPAGIQINADGPGEIAVSIAAEAVAWSHRNDRRGP